MPNLIELQKIRKFDEEILKNNYSSYVMGLDVGGTNTNIGVAGVKDGKTSLLFSLNFKTKQLESLIPAINQTMEYSKDEYGIDINAACIGAAGVVSNSEDYVELTNINLNISARKILEKTTLSNVRIINDFQAIGYGINILDPNNKNDVYIVRSKKVRSNSTKAVIGAGTGFGKSILVFNHNIKAYIPLESEGGHSEVPLHDDFEFDLANYIKEKIGIEEPLPYEEVLSGRGLENVYYFIREKLDNSDSKYSKEIDYSNNKPELISKYKDKDKICKKTFKLFAKFYGRCAKNFVLDSMASGGLYIAGGIAAKNKEIFESKQFIDEFENAYRRSAILKKVPIYVIINYDVSLLGACFAAMLNENR
jgi:glucokinase